MDFKINSFLLIREFLNTLRKGVLLKSFPKGSLTVGL